MKLNLRRFGVAGLMACACAFSVGYSGAADENDPWFEMPGTWNPDANDVAAVKAAFYPVGAASCTRFTFRKNGSCLKLDWKGWIADRASEVLATEQLPSLFRELVLPRKCSWHIYCLKSKSLGR